MEQSKKINVMLSPSEWKELRMQAISEDTSASAIVRRLVSRHLTRKAIRRGRKASESAAVVNQ